MVVTMSEVASLSAGRVGKKKKENQAERRVSARLPIREVGRNRFPTSRESDKMALRAGGERNPSIKLPPEEVVMQNSWKLHPPRVQSPAAPSLNRDVRESRVGAARSRTRERTFRRRPG